jgi:glucan phosphoethanolaminetransferase (alkaline phosphatase superfamily)
MNLTEQQLLEIYDIVFSNVHSKGFKTAEVRTLLFDREYWFMQKPKENWYENLIQYLQSINFDLSLLKMNSAFKNI